MVFRPQFWPTVTTLPLVVLGLALGVWQLQRLEWKSELIRKIEAGLAEPPQPVDDLLAEVGKLDDAAFRAVTATGTFDHRHEAHVFGTAPDGQVGYRVFTPLRSDPLAVVFVARGFVPAALKDPATRPGGQIEGRITVTGIARLPQPANAFQPDNMPARNEWFTVDLDAMATEAGVTDALPVYISAGPTPVPGGWPRGAVPQPNLPNNHLGYAVTWFALTLAVAVIYVLYHLRDRT